MVRNSHNGFILQDRDLHLLHEIGTMRVVDREQAKCVAGFGSTRRVNYRLLGLTRAGLLRRFFLGTKAGGQKALYTLSASGAKRVDVPFRGLRRRSDEVLVADFSPTKTLAAFLEVDLGNEGLSVWKSKVQNYLQYAISGNFEKRFGHPQFRVLVIVSTERRMRYLQTATLALTDKIFWFSTLESVAGAGFWSPVWFRARNGECQSLFS